MIRVPDALEWWRQEPGGAEWLERLPRLAAECAEQWSLRLGEPFTGGNVSLTVAAEGADGTPAVLKINFPDPESEQEADALAHYGGNGAVLLLAADPARRALLIERCRPGNQLWEVQDEDEANRVAAGVLRRLWRPPPRHHAFRLLAGEAELWMSELPGQWEALGRPFERELLDEAVAALRELAASQGEPVVLHQDFHGGNVLQATREPWLAIDPKPLVGEREFDAASLLRDRRWEIFRADASKRIRRRLDLLAVELGLERERLRRWGIAHALAWGIDGTAGKVEPDMVEAACLLRDARTVA